MGDTLRKVAQNESLAALSRIAVFIVSGASLPIGIWIVATIMALTTQNAVQQAALDAQAKSIETHAQAIAEAKRVRDQDRDAFLSLRTDVGRVLEKVDGQTHALGRIEAFLDAQRPPRP